MKVLTTAAVAVLLHLVLGWAWTLGAGMAAGVWVGRGGWLVGSAGVGLAWAALVGYNLLVAGPEVRAMLVTMGGLLGNMASWAVVGLTLLIGAVLGALGGLLGGPLHRVWALRRTPARA